MAKMIKKAKDDRVKNLSKEERQILANFGITLRKKREEQDLTLYDIEDRGYASWQHWQKLESGLRDIKFTTIIKICKALKIQPSELLETIKVKIK